MNSTHGRLNIVGIGPGHDDHMTPAALKAIQEAHYVIGYTTYISLVRPHLAGKQVTRTGMTEEIGRAQMAVETARAGNIVTLVSSGDAGVYGMAGLVFEVLRNIGWKRDQSPEIRIIPGVTAANSCASLVGAPLIHDTCRISLSDLLTPWPAIETRLDCAAKGDFVIVLYNPASGRRQRQIVEASRIIKQYRPGTTPVALVKSAFRVQESIILSDLDHFLDFEIGMNTTVIVGNTNTFIYEGYMVTPRGYRNKYDLQNGAVKEGQRKAFSLRCDGDMASREDGMSGTTELSSMPKLNVTKIPGAFMKMVTENIPQKVQEVQKLGPTNSPQKTDTSVSRALEALQILNKVQKTPPKMKSESPLEKRQLSFWGKLSGAIIFKSEGKIFLIGALKSPCCFDEYGLSDPLEKNQSVQELTITSAERTKHLKFEFAVTLKGVEGAQEIYERLAIYRNSSISERLTSLVKEVNQSIIIEGVSYRDARWMEAVPLPVWSIVRESMLKCS